MSNFETFNAAETKKMTGMPEQVFVFASPGTLDGLDALSATLTLVEIDPAASLPRELVNQARIAVVEVNPADRRSIARLDALRAARPDLAIIAGLLQVDLSITRLMLRKGIGDVVAMPFTTDELFTAVLEVERELADLQAGAPVDLAPVFAIQKCAGGLGATTLATHLADAMARELGEGCRACIIDLDLQSGDAASYFDRRSRKSLLDLIEAGARLDGELFKSVAIEANAQVDIVAAPQDIIPIEDVELAALNAVVNLARQRYDLVLFDMPGVLTNWAMSALLGADAVVLVANGSIGTLRQAKRKLHLLRNFDFDQKRVAIALNAMTFGPFRKANTRSIEEALGHSIAAVIHSDTQLLEQAQAQGILAMDVQRRSKFAADIAALADHLLALVEEG